ncbi:MAG TPA: hypothetical protein VGR00_10395 [Thermoanaerobaculia bacterium]|jgi:hypothetical protein|nr:hypothetical protein [Thermoanaerobaculia bacterium]
MTNDKSHPGESELLLHAYESDAAIARHVGECTACRGRLEALQGFLGGLTGAEPAIPERGDWYGRDVWRRIEPRLSKPRPKFARLFPSRTLAYAGILAAVVFAFFLGRGWPAGPAVISPSARERILVGAVGEHLQRSELVLLELANAGDASLTKEQARAEELVLESRLYRQAALRSGDQAMAGILDDIERLLLDVARAPAPLTQEDQEAFRHRIDRSGVLFKARILRSRLGASRI